MSLLPLILTGLAVVVALLPTERRRSVGAAGVVLLGLGLAALEANRGPGAGMPAGFLAVNTGLMLLGLAAVAMAFATRTGAERASLSQADGGRETPRGAGLLVAGYAAGLAAAALGQHLAVVFGGMALAAWCGWALGNPRPGWWMAVPALASLLLLFCGWFLATIAGPEGLAISAVPLLPLSPAAERMLSLVIVLLIWLFSALWPLRPRRLAAALTAPLALLLLIRVGLPATPVGLAHWQPLAFPLAVIGIWAAALARHPSMLLRAGAMLGLASLDPRGLAGAAVLLLTVIGREWIDRTRKEQVGWGPVARAGIAAAAAWGGLAAAAGGLRAQVVYTVLGAIGTAVGLSRRLRPPGRTLI